ncbi:hypothetical protein Ddye_006069 [Dipteronia dyeriana]|uniref:DUF1985 domain-containing protein n=1 Tax=Dipteronia dyeriana TaxID=168575 RepID=A0AAD9XHC1_9ROSI|nr:hypothetical protein Ddye_006069 [Dipteronia dyeriana]
MHRQMNFSGGVIHWLLMRELHHDGPTDDMRFMLGNHSVRFMLGNHSVRFSNVEFCLITGLRFRVITDMIILIEFQQPYDAEKLCLYYVDERVKTLVCKFRLVEDLDAFDAFPWGAHLYMHSIYSFKHALDGKRERFERHQQINGANIHTVETYNIYGLSHALLMFVRTGLVPTATESQPYFTGIDEGSSLYIEQDMLHIPEPVSDQTTTDGE